MGRTLVLLVLLAVSSCRANIPDGRFACTSDVDCPPGQSCIDEVCRAGDAGVGVDVPGLDAPGLDAPGIDAPGLDAPMLDAPRDGGRDAPIDAGPSLRLRVVNAIGDDGGVGLAAISVAHFGGTTSIDFGCVATITAYRGIQHFDVTAGTRTAGVDVNLPAADSILVFGRNPSGAVVAELTPDVLPTAGAGLVAVQYLHFMSIRATTDHRIITDPNDFTIVPALPFGDWSARTELPATEPVAVGMTYWEGLTPHLVTTFTLPAQSALVVLTGDADRHPGSPGGPRAIVIPPATGACEAPILPDPYFAAVNIAHDRAFGASPAFFCQLGTPLAEARLDGGQISLPGTIFAGHSTFALDDAAGTCTNPSAFFVDVMTDFAGVTPEPGGRYLLALTGEAVTTEPNLWELTLLAEPPGVAPASAGSLARSGVVYAHLARRVVPVEIDFEDASSPTGSPTVLADMVGPLSFETDYVQPSTVGTTGYRIVRDSGGLAIGVWPGMGAPASVGGVFAILAEIDPAFAPPVTRRFELVLAPYGGRPWDLRGRD